MGVTKVCLLAAGVCCILYVAWQLDSIYTPPVNQYSTPANACTLDAKLLEGSRHVAPLAYKKWLEEQAELRAQQAAAQPAPPAAAGSPARTDCPHGYQVTPGQNPTSGIPAAWGSPNRFVNHAGTLNCERVRMVVHR